METIIEVDEIENDQEIIKVNEIENEPQIIKVDNETNQLMTDHNNLRKLNNNEKKQDKKL